MAKRVKLPRKVVVSSSRLGVTAAMWDLFRGEGVECLFPHVGHAIATGTYRDLYSALQYITQGGVDDLRPEELSCHLNIQLGIVGEKIPYRLVGKLKPLTKRGDELLSVLEDHWTSWELCQ